jgi:predicted ABC-type ATPase
LLIDLVQQGYRVVVFFLWLPSADVAVVRVANRVHQGGHDVPEVDIRRRFGSGLTNFFRLYGPMSDAWYLFDASRSPPTPTAREEDGRSTVEHPDLLALIRKDLGG